MRWVICLGLVLTLGIQSSLGSSAEMTKEPELYIPFCKKAPVIDGKISPDEWKYAAVISMFEAYPSGVPRVMRMEQPVFYLMWDRENLYIAMNSIDSNTNTIVAACSMHDNVRIIGDDCMEMMIAPGTRDDVKRIDLPVYYFAINSIGTIWDAKFYPLLAETHNSWESDVEIANSVDGTHWMCEVRIPLKVISKNLPEDGTTWRMNFDRTYSGYKWSAWNAGGGLNDARVGGNVTFDSKVASIRLLSVDAVADGKLKVLLEAANPTDKAQKVKLRLSCTGQRQAGKDRVEVGKDEKEVAIKSGEVKEVILGRDQNLLSYNNIILEAVDQDGKKLFFIERKVNIPCLRFVKRIAPEVPLVYIFPRFLPSLERLAVIVDYTAWAKKTGYVGNPPKAEIKVFRKGEEDDRPVIEGVFTEFKDNRGTWRHTTKDLPEGEYSVKVKLTAGKGEVIADYDDWFEKKIFDWMVNKRGVGEEVPAPYTALVVKGKEVKPWGRTYRFASTGLLAGVNSQGKKLLAGEAELTAEIDNKPVKIRVETPFSFTETKKAKVYGKSSLKAGNLRLEIESVTEYDGFILYRLTYRPEKAPVKINRLRLKVPMVAKYAKFYSASGDTQGTSINGEVLPDKQGKVFDSLNNTRAVCCSPTFATLFWVGDYETSFCYASDNDKGWLIRDDAPAVEVYREGDELILWLNFVDKEYTLTEPRTLEFAFQAGPLKPLPEGWRGIQDGGNLEDAPLTISQVPFSGGGHTMCGGTNFIHPGDTPEMRKKSREHIEKAIAGGKKAVVGYHYWGCIPKGRLETRVFRGEWGIDKHTWDAAKKVSKWAWSKRFYGENKDLYILMYINPVPSYVDFIIHGYDEALKETQLSGFYDDTGYPKPVFDEELGLGFVREDGRKVYSSGLWIYRERWKRAAYLNFKHNRPNFLRDSQHVHGHFMPAYGFIGIWAPCERGYYNPFNDRDNLDFYRSIERYVAFNPSKQFGQIPMIGMSSPQRETSLFSRDTRCMMMLAMLNDQDVGSFGSRDSRTVYRLRHARNIFKQWEKDVKFMGYWQSGDLVTCDDSSVLVSLYHRPQGVLFIVGNVGEKSAVTTIEPNWKKLKIEHRKVEAINTETGERLSLDAGTSRKGFEIEIPRHDVRLITVGVQGEHPVKSKKLGAELTKPREIITELSDSFEGPALASSWQKDLHEGDSSTGILDGRFYVQGAHYGYAHIRRELGVDNVSVQCLIMRKPTGCADTSGGSLFLYWENGEYLQATPGTQRGNFLYVVSGKAPHRGSEISKEAIPGWYPHYANWVKITLKQDEIEFYCSSDGKNWKKDWALKRDAKHGGAPQYLMLGNGHPGENPYLNNVISKHFKPSQRRAYPCTFFSDLIVGGKK